MRAQAAVASSVCPELRKAGRVLPPVMCSVVAVLLDFIFHLLVVMHSFNRSHVRRLRLFSCASRHPDFKVVRSRILTLSVTFYRPCLDRLGDGDEGSGWKFEKRMNK